MIEVHSLIIGGRVLSNNGDLSMENNSSDVSNLISENIAINIATAHSYKLTLSPDHDAMVHAPFAKKRMLIRRRLRKN